MNLSFKFNHPEYPDTALNDSILEILESNILCAIATIKEDQTSYIHTAYYCFNDSLDFFFLSDPNSQHCRNITINDTVAIAIYNSDQPWAEDQKGAQILGRCQQAKGRKLIEATTLYLKRFTSLSDWIKHPDDFVKGALDTRPFVIKTHWLQLYDTKRFGDENFIPLPLRHT